MDENGGRIDEYGVPFSLNASHGRTKVYRETRPRKLNTTSAATTFHSKTHYQQQSFRSVLCISMLFTHFSNTIMLFLPSQSALNGNKDPSNAGHMSTSPSSSSLSSPLF
jgi:hypothetical protein